MIELKYPVDNTTVSVQTSEQKNFIEDTERRKNTDGAMSFKWYDLEEVGIDRTSPLPISFSWYDDEEKVNSKSMHYFVLISERSDMRDAWVYSTNKQNLDVYNLKVGTKYYWCVQKNGKRSCVSSFSVLATYPRCIKLDGTANVRDIGGYPIEEGRIRQGLLYRGAEFELHLHLTSSGAEELQRLGIKTELDMREEAKEQVDFSTAEAVGIKRVFVPVKPYTAIFDKKCRPMVKKFYRLFANPKNYPMYFHCWGGADRTGTFAFILEALLGVSYEDLMLDYEFTSLAIWGIRTRNFAEFQRFLEMFMSLSGNTLSEKARTFLKTYAELTDKQIATICDILIEKTNKI